jgi:hypothetical protein
MNFDLVDRDIAGPGQVFETRIFDIMYVIFVPGVVVPVIQRMCSALVSNVTHQDFSIMMESIIELKRASYVDGTGVVMFSSAILGADQYVNFVTSVSEFVFGTAVVSSEYVVEFKFLEVGSGTRCLRWYRHGGSDGAVFSCECGNSRHSIVCDEKMYGIYFSPQVHRAYACVGGFAFRAIFVHMGLERLRHMQQALFKPGVSEDACQKYVVGILDISETYSNSCLRGIKQYIRVGSDQAYRLISECVSHYPVTEYVNGSTTTLACVDPFFATSEIRIVCVFDWEPVSEGCDDLVLRRFVVMDTDEDEHKSDADTEGGRRDDDL